MQTNDDGMKEIIREFVTESRTNLEEFVGLLETMEDEKKGYEQGLLKVGAAVDRIMGAAETLSFADIGTMTRLAKEISYKSTKLNNQILYPKVVAVLLDTSDFLDQMLSELEDSGKMINIREISNDAFKTRLKWLADKFSEVEHGSVDFKKDAGPLKQDSIDDIMKQFGVNS